MAQLRRRESHRRSDPSVGRRTDAQPKLLCNRTNQKLIAGYPSDSPVSTTDEECEAEDLNHLKGHSNLVAEPLESPGPEEWFARAGLAQHHALLTGGTGARGTKRHWAPGEGVIDQHLFLLDDRPWQEFYTLLFSPAYLVIAFVLLTTVMLLLIDGTVMYDQLLVLLVPGVVFAVGVLANLLFVGLFPVPSGCLAPAYDNWTDPFQWQ